MVLGSIVSYRATPSFTEDVCKAGEVVMCWSQALEAAYETVARMLAEYGGIIGVSLVFCCAVRSLEQLGPPPKTPSPKPRPKTCGSRSPSALQVPISPIGPEPSIPENPKPYNPNMSGK